MRLTGPWSVYILVIGFSLYEWELQNKKQLGLFDFRFEAQNQQLKCTAFFFHYRFLIHFTK